MEELFCKEFLFYLFFVRDVEYFYLLLMVNCILNVIMVVFIIILNCIVIYVVRKVNGLLMFLKMFFFSFVIFDFGIGLFS